MLWAEVLKLLPHAGRTLGWVGGWRASLARKAVTPSQRAVLPEVGHVDASTVSSAPAVRHPRLFTPPGGLVISGGKYWGSSNPEGHRPSRRF